MKEKKRAKKGVYIEGNGIESHARRGEKGKEQKTEGEEIEKTDEKE